MNINVSDFALHVILIKAKILHDLQNQICSQYQDKVQLDLQTVEMPNQLYIRITDQTLPVQFTKQHLQSISTTLLWLKTQVLWLKVESWIGLITRELNRELYTGLSTLYIIHE